MKPFDSLGNEILLVETGGQHLRRAAVRGAGATVLSNVMGLGAQIVSTIVLGRLLVPSDFGLITMATTFSLLLINCGLNGLTEAVVQRDSVDDQLASNLFWINVGVGAVLTLLFAASAPLIARMYHTPDVLLVIVGISATIFLTSPSVIHLALMKRAMQFKAVSANDVLARVLSITASIVFAFFGWGVWALVAGAIVQAISTTAGAWWMCRWLPRLPRTAHGTSSMVRYAATIYGRFSVNYFTRNTDNLLIGWKFDARSLGFYKRAYDVFVLSAGYLVTSTTVVAVSALSRIRHDPAEYCRKLLSALTLIVFVGMGIGSVLMLAGTDIILLLLGPQWRPAGTIFVLFGPGVGAMVLYYTHAWIHLSIGTPDRWFRWGIIEFAVTLLLFLVGLPWGPAGIAAAWTLSYWLLAIPAIWYAGKPIGFTVTPLISRSWRYVVAAVMATAGGYALFQRFAGLETMPGLFGTAVRIVAKSGCASILYVTGVVVLHGGFGPIRKAMDVGSEMLPARFRRLSQSDNAVATDSSDAGTPLPVGQQGSNS